MKKISIGNHLTPYLLAVSALLAGSLALQSHNMIQAQSNSSTKAQPGLEQVSSKHFTAPGVAAFSEIVERPLFNAGREPLAEQTAPAAKAKVSLLRLQLEGVALTPTSRIALVRDISNNKMLHLTAGMKHQGWELTSVSDTVATFKRGSESQELTLVNNKNKRSR